MEDTMAEITDKHSRWILKKFIEHLLKQEIKLKKDKFREKKNMKEKLGTCVFSEKKNLWKNSWRDNLRNSKGIAKDSSR